MKPWRGLLTAATALALIGAATAGFTALLARPLAARVPPLTTYLLYPESEPLEVLERFIGRVQAIESLESPRPMRGRCSDISEEPAS